MFLQVFNTMTLTRALGIIAPCNKVLVPSCSERGLLSFIISKGEKRKKIVWFFCLLALGRAIFYLFYLREKKCYDCFQQEKDEKMEESEGVKCFTCGLEEINPHVDKVGWLLWSQGNQSNKQKWKWDCGGNFFVLSLRPPVWQW